MIPEYMKYYTHCIVIGLVIILGSITTAFGDNILPDPVLTPGKTYTTDANVACKAHTGSESDSIRNVPESEKQDVFRVYHTTNHTGICKVKGCEVDHLISIKLGGSNDKENLWIQSYDGKWNAIDKDNLEKRLIARVCRVSKKHPIKLDLKVAQDAINKNWIEAYIKYVTNNQ